MALNITRGIIPCGQKIVIYGVPGIGKTTLAAQFPGAVFIDTEGGTRNFDVARLPTPTSWEMLKSEAQQVLDNPEGISTLVIDTADWAAKMCNAAVCAKAGKQGIEDFGYGNGYTYAAEEYGRFLDILDRISSQAGIHVVVTAHSVLKHVEQPDQFGKYDQWELKCDPKIAALTKEWADMILFCNYKVTIITTDTKGQKGKGQGGQRTMYTSTRPSFVAKNRFGLPDEMPMDFGQIAHLFPNRIPNPTIAQPGAVTPTSGTVDAGAVSGSPASLSPNDAASAPPETRSVQTQEQVPAPAVSAAQEAEVQAKEPDIDPLTGRDRYEGIYPPLADLLRTRGINPIDVQDIVHGAGILPTGPNGAYIEIQDYPEGLCQEIVSKWDSFWALSEQYCNLPF